MIDNISQKPVRLIDKYDNKTVEKSREVFTTFFRASTIIDIVYIVEKLTSNRYNYLDWRLMETPYNCMQL